MNIVSFTVFIFGMWSCSSLSDTFFWKKLSNYFGRLSLPKKIRFKISEVTISSNFRVK